MDFLLIEMDYRRRSVIDKLKLNCLFNCQLEAFGNVQVWNSGGRSKLEI